MLSLTATKPHVTKILKQSSSVQIHPVTERTAVTTEANKRRASRMIAPVGHVMGGRGFADVSDLGESSAMSSFSSEGPAPASERVSEDNPPPISEQRSKHAVFHSHAPKTSKRYLLFRLCSCCFPRELVHQLHQRKHNYHESTREMTEGETLIHHYEDPKLMKSKFSPGATLRDSQGNRMNVVDNKQPTAEEVQLYTLKAVGESSIHSQISNPNNEESGGNLSNTSASSYNTARRRITFHRTESMEADDPDGGDPALFSSFNSSGRTKNGSLRLPDSLLTKAQLEKRASRPKKHVRVLPIVRITVIENFHNYDKEDWDLDLDCKTTSPLHKTDLWYCKADIKAFRRQVKQDNASQSWLKKMPVQNQHALIWFQTFGKFFGEPGDEFSPAHEVSMFGYSLNNIQLPKKFYATATLSLGDTPLEYRDWQDGKYFTTKHSHSHYVTDADSLVTHEEYNAIHMQAQHPEKPYVSPKFLSDPDCDSESLEESTRSSADPVDSEAVHRAAEGGDRISEPDSNKNTQVKFLATIKNGNKTPHGSSSQLHEQMCIIRSSTLTSMVVDDTVKNEILALSKSMKAAGEEDIDDTVARSESHESGFGSKFMNLDDEADKKSNKSQSFRIRAPPSPTSREGGEEGGAPGAPKHEVMTPGSLSKFAERNKSLKSLMNGASRMTGSGRNLLRGKISSGRRQSPRGTIDEDEEANTFEMKMDEDGAAVVQLSATQAVAGT
jgi:hypothetical protein